jgi:hypothetical protein
VGCGTGGLAGNPPVIHCPQTTSVTTSLLSAPPRSAGAARLRQKTEQTAESAPGLLPTVTISPVKACREGGTLAVPFQDRDHDMMMDHHIMIFFCAPALRSPGWRAVSARRVLRTARQGPPPPDFSGPRVASASAIRRRTG